MTKILVLPDVQAKPGNDFSFLTSIGNYILAKQPDVIVNIGDFSDMESLSTIDGDDLELYVELDEAN